MVSRFLNGSGYISADAAQAMTESVEKLEYELNLVSRSLNTKRSNLNGLILPEFER
ncbi:hypothetical protein [Planococcus sp. ISL-109]|uniref:hypothetical protein n=1 Tax=Planococcus sp. ISL-109 TaxID=2819166 RepID=UPI00333AB258